MVSVGRGNLVDGHAVDSSFAVTAVLSNERSQRGPCLVLRYVIRATVTPTYSTKDKVFPYSLPSVGPGADPGVQAVSPQVT